MRKPEGGGGFPESESLQTLDINPGGFEIRWQLWTLAPPRFNVIVMGK